MPSVNKVTLLGNLGRDPEVRYSPDGVAICNMSLATTSTWKDKASGERREETEWHRLVMYGRLAEIAGEYLKKGRSIYIEGRLKTRKWQDKDTGADRYSTEVIADEMQMLGGRDDDDDRGGYGGQQQERQPRQQQPAQRGGQGQQSRGGYDDERQPQQRRQSYGDEKGRSAPRQQTQQQQSRGAADLADMSDDIPF